MAKRNFSKFQSLYNQSMIDISLINNNQLNQFYTIPYGTKTVPIVINCILLALSYSSKLLLLHPICF